MSWSEIRTVEKYRQKNFKCPQQTAFLKFQGKVSLYCEGPGLCPSSTPFGPVSYPEASSGKQLNTIEENILPSFLNYVKES